MLVYDMVFFYSVIKLLHLLKNPVKLTTQKENLFIVKVSDMGTGVSDMGTGVFDMSTRVFDMSTRVSDMGTRVSDMGTESGANLFEGEAKEVGRNAKDV